jgi:OmpA-OmpF porin, OOP family
MSFVENLIDQIARATGLGDNTRKFVGVLASFIFSRPDGFKGFQKTFQKAGLGGPFESWLSGSPSMRTIDASQVRNALGDRNLEAIAQKSGLPTTQIGPAIAGALPLLVRSVTAGGVIPNGLPSTLAGLIGGGNIDWGKSSVTHLPGSKKRGSLWRWLLPILALLALAWCGWHMRNVKPTVPATSEATGTAPVAATDGTAVAVTAPRLAFENNAGKVTVSGALGTTAEKFEMLEALKSTFGQQNVSGDIDVDASISPASWLDKLKALLPSLKGSGLKFGFEGDKLKLDTTALSDAERISVSSLFQKELPNLEVDGLVDPGVKAIQNLKPGYTAQDLTAALNKTTVLFATGSAKLTPSSSSIVRSAAEAIQGAPAGTRVEVKGHTDNQGTATENQLLSEQRAKAVADALIADGVPADRLASRGFGSNRPVGDNSTEKGRAANRRIEYEVVH